MDRNHIDKIAQSPDDRILLARVWDKIHAGVRRNVISCTGFLSPRELEMTRYLFGSLDGLRSFGGYEQAERKILVYLPNYLDESELMAEDSPVVCLRASFYHTESPSHRDFLGALMGSGIARQAVGDICVGAESCDFFVTREIAGYLLDNFNCVGRVSVQLTRVPLSEMRAPIPKTVELRDTLASVRLDSVISSGFRISRSLATQHIEAGHAAIDGLPCMKPDKAVDEGANISVRGLGKIHLRAIQGLTKKGRISVVIDRYV